MNAARLHALAPEALARHLKSDPARGLSQAEARHRLAREGPNTLAAAPGRSAPRIFIDQFRSLVIALLVAAGAIAFTLDKALEAMAIGIVVLLNAAIGFVTEWKAQQTLTALARQAVALAQVVRDGAEHQIAAAELVPGDLVVLAAGARVPADGRLVECVRLQIDESALTGESHPAAKSVETLGDTDVPLAERSNMAYMGTSVVDGRARLLVTATGSRTEIGGIGRLIDEAGEREAPLERKLARLGRLLLVVVLALSALIVLAGWWRGNDFLQMLEVGISLAIAAVPEGLPAVATMTLALGMQRMARKGALVRRLASVEALGSSTLICTDKTGTLTKNEMTASALVVDRRHVSVSGAGYAPVGEFDCAGRRVDVAADGLLQQALRIGALCNDAKVERGDGAATVLGDPTEAALVVLAQKAGLDEAAMAAAFPRLAEWPFDSKAQRMTTVHRTPQGGLQALVKGSPGVVLAACIDEACAGGSVPLTADARRVWEEANLQLARGALRVLALAWRELPPGYAEADLGRGLTLVGLVGLADPLRDEARAAIAACRGAGIRTVMITGDQARTASEIAHQLGIDRAPDGQPLRTVHGRELDGLDSAGWQRAVEGAAAFARVTPAQKLQIVQALQARGHIVAMTGDGVNDAPALQQADIGIAMGRMGSEVAKETADMIITDDNFATIVGAVEQGRVIYANILRAIHYLFSCNLAEILCMFIAIMLAWPLPLGALQILWLNMITDIFPALALALEPSSPGLMNQPPRDPKQALLPPRFLAMIAWQGLLIAGVTLLAFHIGLQWYGEHGEGLRRAVTMAFMTLALAQVVHALNARSQRGSAFDATLFRNRWFWAALLACVLLQLAAVNVPWLRTVLGTVAPGGADWLVIAACSLAPLLVVETVKQVQGPARWVRQRTDAIGSRS